MKRLENAEDLQWKPMDYKCELIQRVKILANSAAENKRQDTVRFPGVRDEGRAMNIQFSRRTKSSCTKNNGKCLLCVECNVMRAMSRYPGVYHIIGAVTIFFSNSTAFRLQSLLGFSNRRKHGFQTCSPVA